ncbi:hypothetical protein NQZ68_022498 [Dissostichus eleginoides]|nr:hypothetical protein NQZ68_022498 [Dissostichus eleginoides]
MPFEERSGKDSRKLEDSQGLDRDIPVIMLMEVTANAAQKIGTLVDPASDHGRINHMGNLGKCPGAFEQTGPSVTR